MLFSTRNSSIARNDSASAIKNPNGDNDAAPEHQEAQLSPRSLQKKKKQLLKQQQKALIAKYKRVKQLTIDFYSREDLTVTTLKEFFEIFISSLKKEQAFHQELVSIQYKYIGLGMKFDLNNA